MKKILAIILCSTLLFMLCACKKDNETKIVPTVAQTVTPTVAPTLAEVIDGDPQELIVGTWISDNVNKDCYFIFEENGDAFAKWGTTTVYGSYDYYEEDGVFDIDIPNFIFNEYIAVFTKDTMRLTSEDSKFNFTRATMPQVTIKAPSDLKTDEKLYGNWQSAETTECFEFKDDNTATITDVYNFTTVDCKYSCSDSKITIYYMTTTTKDGNKELSYSVSGDDLVLDGYSYHKLSTNE